MSEARRVVARLARRPPVLIACAVVAAFVVIAAAAPQLAPFDPVAPNLLAMRKAPSAVYRLGTDEVGRDVLSRLIWGARASLLAGVIPVGIAVIPPSPNPDQRGELAVPRFVLMTMTPFAAAVPYNAAADGPLMMSTDSMSSGLSWKRLMRTPALVLPGSAPLS